MESFSSCSKLIELTDAHKTEDDTLIIIVNEDGTISVDPSTLQKLLASQPNQNSRLSVVSVDSATYDDPPKVETSADAVENSGSVSQIPTTSSSVTAPSDYPLVDPFVDMDQEELQKLELALKSEKGRQILGENVAAMLDMLNKEGETHIAEGTHILSQNIHNDHCYSASTTKSMPTTPTKATTQTAGPKTIAVKTQNLKVVQETPGQDKKLPVLKQTTLGTQFRLVQSLGGVSQLILHKDGKPTILQRAAAPPAATVTSTSKPITPSNKTSNTTITSSSSNVEEEMVKAMESISTAPTGTTPGGGSERKTVLRSHPPSPAAVVRATATPAPTPPPQLPPSKYPRRENRRPPAHLVNEAFETPLAPPPTASTGQTISTPPPPTPASSRRPTPTATPTSDVNVPQSNLSPAEQKISALDLLESIHAAVDMDIGGTQSSDEDEEEEDDDIEEFTIDTSVVGVGSQDKLFDSPVKQPPPSPSVTSLTKPPPFNLSPAPPTEANPSPDTTKPSVELETVAMLPEMPHHPATEFFNVDNIEPTIGIGMELSTDHLTHTITPTTLTLPHTTTQTLPHTTSLTLPHTTTQPGLGVNSSLPSMMMVLPSSSSHHQQQMMMMESPISSTVMTTGLLPSEQDVSESVGSHLTRSTGVSSLSTPITILHSTTPSSGPSSTPPAQHSTIASSISHASSIIAHPPARSPAASVVAPDSTTHPEIVATGVESTTPVTAVLPPTVKHVRKQVIPTTSASGVPATLSKAVSSDPSLVKAAAAVAGKKATTATGGRRDSVNRKSPDAAAAVDKKRRSSESSRGRKSTDSSVPAAVVDDDDDMPEEDDASWNSEDDPDRLWCICQKPHNNRFMICCDSCDSWFHGKCVGITKAMGNQMEERGIEWRCPTCKEKLKTGGEVTASSSAAPALVKATPPQLSANRKAGGLVGSPNRKSATARKPRPEPAHDPLKKIHTASVQCVVCNKLDALQGSMYCSDACIQTHVTESLARIGTYKQDTHLIVFERKTGNILSGINAPTASSVRPWIQANPSYQVMAPSKLPTSQFYNKPGSGPAKPQGKPVKPSPAQKLNQQLMKANQEGLKELMKPVILTKQVKPGDGSSTTPGSKIKVVKLVRTPISGDKLKQELITKHLVPASSTAQSQQGSTTVSSSSSNVKIIQLPTSATGGTKIVQLVKVPVHKPGTPNARLAHPGTPNARLALELKTIIALELETIALRT
uniref:Death-inducer obliterator 1 n=1 Tax=Cacopsylla melanoneura TaxID=428564 RepID=A0A8D9EV27_9HEMI